MCNFFSGVAHRMFTLAGEEEEGGGEEEEGEEERDPQNDARIGVLTRL